MTWTADEATALLHAAFPWGAHVSVAHESAFVSLHHEVTNEEVGTEAVEVRFARDPGDTIQRVTRVQLEHAMTTGVLEVDGGARIRQPEVGDVELLASPHRDLLGYQAPSDAMWVKRMRLHQSWWRTFRLRVPYGSGPTRNATRRYGNMLDANGGEAGLNFLTPEARQAYEDRVAVTTEGVDPFRTTRNLLASQPMAFNLFGHLGAHLPLATALFRELLGRDEVGEVLHIEIERLSKALGDRTAFDAFATYLRPDGQAACLAIETKLTEPFSQQAYDWDKYLAHPAFDPAVWITTDGTVLGDPLWSQLWRNHLLARAESAAIPELGPPTVLVVHHPLGPHCSENVASYRDLLTDPDTVQAIDLHQICQALEDLVSGDPHQAQWLADLNDRYLNLPLSERLTGLSDREPSEQ